MALGKILKVVVLILTVALAGTGLGWTVYRGLMIAGAAQDARDTRLHQGVAAWEEQLVPKITRAFPGQAVNDTAPAAATVDKSEEQVTFVGQIIATDGKPVADAQVGVLITPKWSGRPDDLTQRVEVVGPVKTGQDGRFRLPPRRFDWRSYVSVQLVASAPKHGLGWRDLVPGGKRADMVVSLPKEQVFQGRLVDLQGEPAANVAVRLQFVGVKRPDNAEGVNLWGHEGALPIWPPPVTTAKDGRFAFRGLGLDSALGFDVVDERFARQSLYGKENKADAKEFTWTLVSARIIEGQVIAADTGKPVAGAGVTIFASEHELGNSMGVSGRADDQGRFRMNPYPGSHFRVTAYPPNGEPYLRMDKALTWPKGAVKQHVNVVVPPGAVIRGKITEASSGRSVAGAKVHFVPRLKDNSNVRDNVESGMAITDTTGAYQCTVVAGPGHVMVVGPDEFIQIEMQSNRLYYDKAGGSRYYAHAWQPILAKGGAKQDLPILLRRGVTVNGRLVDAEGKPVAEALMVGQWFTEASTAMRRFSERPFTIPIRAGHFEMRGLDPAGSYTVYFLDPKNKQGAIATISGKDAGGPITVRLVPCGSAAVRFVDAKGKRVAGLSNFALEMVFEPGATPFDRSALEKGLIFESTQFVANIDRLNHWNPPPTDAEGRVTLRALIPGATYMLRNSNLGSKITASQYFKVEAGKTVKLPDVHWSE